MEEAKNPLLMKALGKTLKLNLKGPRLRKPEVEVEKGRAYTDLSQEVL